MRTEGTSPSAHFVGRYSLKVRQLAHFSLPARRRGAVIQSWAADGRPTGSPNVGRERYASNHERKFGDARLETGRCYDARS